MLFDELNRDEESVMTTEPLNDPISCSRYSSTDHSSAKLRLGSLHVKHNVVLTGTVTTWSFEVMMYGPNEH